MNVGRTAGDSVVVLSARAGVALLNLIFGVIVARTLGPSGRGTFELLVLFPVVLVTMTGAGLRPALTYFLARQDLEPAAVVSEGIRLGLRSLLAVSLVGIVAVPIAARTVFEGAVPWDALVIGLLSFPAAVVSSTAVAIIIGLRDFRSSSTLELARAGIRLSTVAGILILRATATTAILGYAFAELIVALGAIVLVSRRGLRAQHRANEARLRRELRSYATEGYLANVIGFLSYRVDVFLVGAFLPPQEVGLYAAAVAVAERLWLPSQAIASVLLPKLTAASPEARQNEIELAGRVILTVTLLAASTVWIAAPPIINLLYSSSFLPAVDALRWILPGIVAMALARLFATRLAAEGAVKTNSQIGAAALLVNVCLNLVLIPRWGIEGAAIASTISYTFNLVSRGVVAHLSGSAKLLSFALLRPASRSDLRALALSQSVRDSESRDEA